MIIQCDASKRESLLAILKQQPLQNTFLLSDIENYGFDKDFQIIWMEDDPIKLAVYILFYDNLAVFSPNSQHLDVDFLARIVATHRPNCIMGRLELLRPVRLEGYRLHSKVMCGRETPPPDANDPGIQVAALEDVGEIHSFLNAIPEFVGMYASRDMIANRIAQKDGVHLIIRKDGRIVCHGNTAAHSSRAVMIGGVATLPEFSRKGYAHRIVMQLCREISGQHKTPCTLCTPAYYDWYYQRVGFTFLCNWGMITTEGEGDACTTS